MMNYFIYNNINSLDMGIRIQSKDIFSTPKRDLNFKSINGRNGDLILSNNRYENVDVSYTVFVVAKSISELADRLTKIKQWLYSSTDSYARLEDSYDSKFYRKAVFYKALDIEDELSKVGVFTINFNCKPFKYDKSGDIEISSMAEPLILTNPYSFESLPYIKLIGTGVLKLIIQNDKGNFVWNFADIDDYIEIDSEQMYFFKENENKNNTVIGTGFPKLLGGENTFTIEGDFSEIKIIPRWCSL